MLGAVLSRRRLEGPNIAVVTHAGGPGVMLTDALSSHGLVVPPIAGEAAEELQQRLFPASSVGNPIDFLATGTAQQLATILEFCENRFEQIDGVAVIFGSPGLFPVDDAYRVLHDAIRRHRKPIYPVLPSVVNAAREAEAFRQRGNVAFPDEVAAARALAQAFHACGPFDTDDTDDAEEHDAASQPVPTERPEPPHAPPSGFLPPREVARILDSVGIPRVPEVSAATEDEAVAAADAMDCPVVMKAIGPVHKSDVGGVALGGRRGGGGAQGVPTHHGDSRDNGGVGTTDGNGNGTLCRGGRRTAVRASYRGGTWWHLHRNLQGCGLRIGPTGRRRGRYDDSLAGRVRPVAGRPWEARCRHPTTDWDLDGAFPIGWSDAVDHGT